VATGSFLASCLNPRRSWVDDSSGIPGSFEVGSPDASGARLNRALFLPKTGLTFDSLARRGPKLDPSPTEPVGTAGTCNLEPNVMLSHLFITFALLMTAYASGSFVYNVQSPAPGTRPSFWRVLLCIPLSILFVFCGIFGVWTFFGLFKYL